MYFTKTWKCFTDFLILTLGSDHTIFLSFTMVRLGNYSAINSCLVLTRRLATPQVGPIIVHIIACCRGQEVKKLSSTTTEGTSRNMLQEVKLDKKIQNILICYIFSADCHIAVHRWSHYKVHTSFPTFRFRCDAGNLSAPTKSYPNQTEFTQSDLGIRLVFQRLWPMEQGASLTNTA